MLKRTKCVRVTHAVKLVPLKILNLILCLNLLTSIKCLFCKRYEKDTLINSQINLTAELVTF